MIDLRGKRPAPPSGFARDRRIQRSRDHVQGLIDQGRVPRSKDFVSQWSRYKSFFIAAQHQGKCAYCETRFVAAYAGDIEHFRPKASVKELRKTLRPGYWWLAYEWHNWLLSCSRCNRAKGSQFPVKGRRRALRPGAHIGEHKLLLNPFDDDPHKHFEFSPDGRVKGKTRQGRACVKVFGLNREHLVAERRRVAEQLERSIKDFVIAVRVGNALLQQSASLAIQGYCAGSASYAAMCRDLVDQRLH